MTWFFRKEIRIIIIIKLSHPLNNCIRRRWKRHRSVTEGAKHPRIAVCPLNRLWKSRPSMAVGALFQSASCPNTHHPQVVPTYGYWAMTPSASEGYAIPIWWESLVIIITPKIRCCLKQKNIYFWKNYSNYFNFFPKKNVPTYFLMITKSWKTNWIANF